jgi:hypothetical protein
MIRKWIIAALIFSACSPEAVTRSRLTARESVFDFGDVVRGTIVSHDFVVFNRSADTAIISRVRPDCPCLSCQVSSNIIPPNDSVVLKISYDNKPARDPIAMYVSVYCGKQDTDPLKILVRENTIEFVTFEPPVLVYSQNNPRSAPRGLRTVRMKNHSSASLTIQSVVDSSGLLNCWVQKRKVAPGDSTVISVRNKKDIPSGFKGKIDVTLGPRGSREVSLAFYGY